MEIFGTVVLLLILGAAIYGMLGFVVAILVSAVFGVDFGFWQGVFVVVLVNVLSTLVSRK